MVSAVTRYASARHLPIYAGSQPSTDLSISWIHTRKVNLANELYFWWLVGILVTAVHLQGVDSILMDTLKPDVSTVLKWRNERVSYMRRAKYCAIPV